MLYKTKQTGFEKP